MQATINSAEAAHFQKTLDKYLAVNRRETPLLLMEKAKRASILFYKGTKAASPSKEKIKQDVINQGWQVKRPKGLAYPYKKGEKRGSQGPLNRMRRGAIARRQKAIGYVASGWLPAMKALGANGAAKDAANFRNPKGSVSVVGVGTDRPGISITNSTPGCVAVEKKHGVVRQGLVALAADMQTYIDRKQQTNMQQAKH